MFLEYRNWRPPEPIRPAPRVTPRAERVLLWILALNVAMLLFGPLAGTSVFQGLRALFAG